MPNVYQCPLWRYLKRSDCVPIRKANMRADANDSFMSMSASNRRRSQQHLAVRYPTPSQLAAIVDSRRLQMKYDPDDPLAKNCPPLNPSPEEVAHQKMLDLCMEKLGYSPDDLLEGLPS
jgi:hypothetical protein